MSHHVIFELLYPCQTSRRIEWEMNWGKALGWISLRQSALCSNRQEINIYRHSLALDSIHVRTNKQGLAANERSSPHAALHTHTDKSTHAFSYLVPIPRLRTEALRHETKAQAKVDKRCLWIFCVTHGNRCLHSPCNYLLTELIPAVKWLAKSMCTQTGPESKVVHFVYLPAPSHTWYTAIITAPDRKLLNLTIRESWTTNGMHHEPSYFDMHIQKKGETCEEANYGWLQEANGKFASYNSATLGQYECFCIV